MRVYAERQSGEAGDPASLADQQESDGSWFGRWGVNYLYGTMCVLRGLDALGFDNHEAMVQQAAEWIRMVQNPDGGWGESCDSYDDPNRKGTGPSTCSQTAWACPGFDGCGRFPQRLGRARRCIPARRAKGERFVV